MRNQKREGDSHSPPRNPLDAVKNFVNDQGVFHVTATGYGTLPLAAPMPSLDHSRKKKSPPVSNVPTVYRIQVSPMK